MRGSDVAQGGDSFVAWDAKRAFDECRRRPLKPPVQGTPRQPAMKVSHALEAPAQIPVFGKRGHQPQVITLLNVEIPFAHRPNPLFAKRAHRVA